MSIPTLEQHLAAHQLGKRIDNNTLVCQCGDFTRDMPGTYDDPYSDHRAHVAATYREARTVTTVEELVTLAEKSIVRDERGRIWQSLGEYWVALGRMTAPERVPFPARVLWMPADEEAGR